MQRLSVIILLFASLSVFGQTGSDMPINSGRPQQYNNPQNRPFRPGKNPNGIPNRLIQLKAIKTAYITKKLELTPDQSARFFPLYNQYQDEMFLVQREIRQNNSPLQSNGKDQVMNELNLDAKKNDIKRRYATEFLKILPPEKVSLIYKSEKEFQDEIIKQMRERKNEAGN